jgi:hypothetical protein
MEASLKMKSKKIIFAIAALCVMAIPALAQNKPANFATKPKLVIGKLNAGQADAFDVQGKATFTLQHVHDSARENALEGKLTYTLPDNARQKISQMTGKPLNQVPSSVTAEKVMASFQAGTSCPIIHINLKATEIDAVGAKIVFPARVTLDIEGIEPGGVDKPTPEQEVAMNLCVWTKQVNNGSIFRGVTRRIRQLLYGEAENK